MSQQLVNLSRFIELLRHGAWIRYGLNGRYLICNDDGVRETVNEPTMQVLCQRKLVTRGGLTPTFESLPRQLSDRNRMRFMRRNIRYTWSGKEPKSGKGGTLAASAKS